MACERFNSLAVAFWVLGQELFERINQLPILEISAALLQLHLSHFCRLITLQDFATHSSSRPTARMSLRKQEEFWYERLFLTV